MIRESDLNQKHPTCWKRRTRLEKSLILNSIFLIVALLVLIGLVIWYQKTQENNCVTPGCIQAASEILKRMDLNIDPCDDFYRFSCGNFEKNTILQADEFIANSFTIVAEQVNEQLRTLMEQPIKSNESRSTTLAKSLYQACMNTTAINAKSLPTLKRIYKNMGGWPVNEGGLWREHLFDWKKTSYKLVEQGFDFNIFFSFQVLPDNNNSSRMILTLDQPYTVSFAKLVRRGFNESIVQAYYNYMVEVAKVFGAPEARASHEMREVMEFLIHLTRITIPSEDRRNTTAENNPMSIREMELTFTYVPWLEYINNFLLDYRTLTPQDVVIVTVPDYFRNLDRLLRRTSKRVLANYMFWLVTTQLVPYLNDELNNLKLEFGKTVSGRSEHSPRWKKCLGEASKIHMAVGALFVQNFFNKEAKESMLELVANVRDRFENALTNVEWMDDITRLHALEKAKAMSVYIAYPEELLDDRKLDEFYKNLTLDKSRYLESAQNYTRFANLVRVVDLFEAVNKSDWRTHAYASVTNAFYDENHNSIEFPAGILQGVFFSNDRPQYMNYGAIGYVIGHEITHGFDDQGQQFDKDGNLYNWWEPKTQESFAEKAQCIIDQYSNLTIPHIGLHLNGINTQGENIADNGAVKYAYLAYEKWVEKHGREQGLPGLKYTPEQLFWISVGNTWCSVERMEYLKLYVMEAYHSPCYYRVNVPLMNSKEFARDFNCPVGSKMNPKDKCSVW